MAVTVIANPTVSPAVISASYPAIIEMTSNIYGTANVTQFRYVAEVVAASPLGTKYTVPIEGVASNGFFDVSELFKLVLKLGRWQYNSVVSEITTISTPLQQNELVNVTFTVQIKEQYYLSGVFTTNSAALLTFVASRGWTDQANDIWGIVNWWQYNSLTNFVPYSGLSKILYAQRTEDPTWVIVGTNPWMNTRMTFYNTAGGVMATINNWFARSSLGWKQVVYVPLYRSGTTDAANYGWVKIDVITSPTSGGAETLEETLYFYKNIETCVDDEAVVMFRDRFFQWSFVSFIKKQNTTINAKPQQAEAIDGRFRYNVKSDDTLTLNTDWVPDQLNEMFKDLSVTEQCYLLAAAGSGTLEALTVVPNSLRLQTSRNEGLHQYTMQFRKSLDNFRA